MLTYAYVPWQMILVVQTYFAARIANRTQMDMTLKNVLLVSHYSFTIPYRTKGSDCSGKARMNSTPSPFLYSSIDLKYAIIFLCSLLSTGSATAKDKQHLRDILIFQFSRRRDYNEKEHIYGTKFGLHYCDDPNDNHVTKH